MKILESSRTLAIPDGVTIEVKGRAVRVKGPRGTLQRESSVRQCSYRQHAARSWSSQEIGARAAVFLAGMRRSPAQTMQFASINE